MELEGAANTFEKLGAVLDLRRVRARIQDLDAPAARAPRMVGSGHVVGAEQLRALLGEEGWADLTGWLERTLTRCWRDHGGQPLSTAEGRFAVAFQDLESGLSCAAFVHRSLREHRSRHGFAPPMRLAVADVSAFGGEADVDTLRALAESQADAGREPEIVVLAAEDATSGSAGLARLREDGVSVRVVAQRASKSGPVAPR
jgi:hypothetical protein